jgi:PIN domain nuclease of toxin-antitoxin system
MKLLLDTNVVIYHAERSPKLSLTAYAAIDNPSCEVFVSAATPAELACLVRKGKFSPEIHWARWFHETVDDNEWRCLDITWEIIDDAFSLPGPMHHDPADRIIVATARKHNLTLVTSDRLLLESPLLACLS